MGECIKHNAVSIYWPVPQVCPQGFEDVRLARARMYTGVRKGETLC